MGKVHILPDEVVQQIAAGEVVERPASVVKELLENALDAGASRVEVVLERAGLSLITVRDNGEGMSVEDAMLALTRHATSKIRSAADLDSVTSLGFRGEALPSIAAVSHLELITAKAGAVAGVRVTSTASGEPQVQECSASTGTIVHVKDLFYNTPARFKFLKSEQTELKRIVEVITRLAVVRPDVSFRATHAGREIISTSGSGDRGEVVSMVLGKGADLPWLEVEAENRLFRVHGWIAPPEFARGTRSQQILMVNGRWIKSPGLSSVVEAACSKHLVSSRHPVFCLEVRTHPGLVDINVHPAKTEVRFSHEQELRTLVHHAVRQALRSAGVPAAALSHRMSGPVIGENTGGQLPLMRDSLGNYVVEMPSKPYVHLNEGKQVLLNECPNSAAVPSLRPKATQEKDSTVAAPRGVGVQWPELIFLGQALLTYLVASGPQGIYLVDQHAAHERILFEKLARDFREGTFSVQYLLVPQTLIVTEPELAIWRTNKDLWSKFGLELEEFGDDTLVLRTIPEVLPPGDAIDLVRELLDQEEASFVLKERLHQLQSAVACHAAIKAGQTITSTEAVALLTELAQCEHPYNCPHGRPTLVCFTRRELEKRFLRRLS
ncbi:MAG: DNA mismatch repair endonuclease MutL [bacterium]|jgi:DNA mismatch repair protein MutL